MNPKQQMPAPKGLFSSFFSDFPHFMEDFELGFPTRSSSISISEDEKNVYVEALMPGLDEKKNEIEVSFDQGVLWMKGQKTEEEKDKKRKYYYKSEQQYSYRVRVPGKLDSKKEPQARYENGILYVTFAKSEQEQPKRIPVKKGA